MTCTDTPESADIIIRTWNSEASIRSCIESALSLATGGRIIIIDHYSNDNTVGIATEYGAEVHNEDMGLGYATRLGIELCFSEYALFIDSDVTVIYKEFYRKAIEILKDSSIGAVVGQARGHPFRFGIPLSLTLMPTRIAKEIHFIDNVAGRETYYIQRYMRKRKLKIRYINDAIIHNSTHRGTRYWPEWQGAWIRTTAGWNPREIAYSLLVVFLMLSNSKSLKNFLYFPFFQAKLLHGFLRPNHWMRSQSPENHP